MSIPAQPEGFRKSLESPRNYGLFVFNEPVSGKQAPTVWFPSMATLAAVLPEDNRALLRLIRQAKPKTMTELAALSRRQVPNLSRTLRMNLVALTKSARQTHPTALATEFLVVLD